MNFQTTYRPQYGLFAHSLGGAVRVLLIVNIVVFIVNGLVDMALPAAVPGQITWFGETFGLSRQTVLPKIWQVVTYMFLHGSFMHLLFNMLILYFMGSEVERELGTRNFLIVYFVSGVLGGLGWLVLAEPHQVCIGASGAIFGLMGAFVALFPNRYITVLLFFILPITMRAWVLVSILATLDFLGMTLGFGRSGIAHAAHLGGLVAGYAFAYTAFRQGFPRIRMVRDVPENRAGLRVLHRDDASPVSAAEVDRILDKIANQGMQSLTRQERAVLEKASEQRQRG